MNITPEQMVSMMLERSNEIDRAQSVLERSLHAEARFEREYSMAKAAAWRTVEGRSREEREAYVDEMCASQKFAYKNAVGESKAALEAVRSKRQQLSALQSAANSIKEEAQFARTSPEEPQWTSHHSMMRQSEPGPLAQGFS